MKLTDYIAQHIIEVSEGGNWTEVDIKNTLQDVTYEEATVITLASPNSIAALLHHVSFYNEVVLQRLKGISPVINDANGFDGKPIESESDWLNLKEEALRSAKNLAEAVKQFPEEKLQELSPNSENTYYKTLHGVTEHAYYHLGQMMILKKLIRQKACNKSSL